LTAIEVIPQFTWPVVAGQYRGIRIHAALVNQELTAIVGAMDSVTFGYGP